MKTRVFSLLPLLLLAEAVGAEEDGASPRLMESPLSAGRSRGSREKTRVFMIPTALRPRDA